MRSRHLPVPPQLTMQVLWLKIIKGSSKRLRSRDSSLTSLRSPSLLPRAQSPNGPQTTIILPRQSSPVTTLHRPKRNGVIWPKGLAEARESTIRIACTTRRNQLASRGSAALEGKRGRRVVASKGGRISPPAISSSSSIRWTLHSHNLLRRIWHRPRVIRQIEVSIWRTVRILSLAKKVQVNLTLLQCHSLDKELLLAPNKCMQWNWITKESSSMSRTTWPMKVSMVSGGRSRMQITQISSQVDLITARRRNSRPRLWPGSSKSSAMLDYMQAHELLLRLNPRWWPPSRNKNNRITIKSTSSMQIVHSIAMWTKRGNSRRDSPANHMVRSQAREISNLINITPKPCRIDNARPPLTREELNRQSNRISREMTEVRWANTLFQLAHRNLAAATSLNIWEQRAPTIHCIPRWTRSRRHQANSNRAGLSLAAE